MEDRLRALREEAREEIETAAAHMATAATTLRLVRAEQRADVARRWARRLGGLATRLADDDTPDAA